MSQSVRLIPLLCTRCKAPVPAKPEETAWVCEMCGQGMRLSEETGTVAQDVFFSSAIAANMIGKPFWVTRGQVSITSRLTYSGNQSKAASAFWSTPHLFFIAARKTSVDEIVSTGVNLLRNPVGMQAGARAQFHSVTLPPSDVRPLAEIMVMSIEADRSDAMRELKFKLDLDPPQLWILP